MKNILNNDRTWWIGVHDSVYENSSLKSKGVHNEVAYFRHNFQLNELGKLKISISAHTRYRLWVNGKPILSGPCAGSRLSWYFDDVDISNYLKIGKNVIAVKVVAFPPLEKQKNNDCGPLWAVSNASGSCLIIEGECINSQGIIIADVTTGRAKWKVYLDNAISWKLDQITFWMGSMEVVYGKLLPRGWKESFYSDEFWEVPDKLWSTKEDLYGVIPIFPLRERVIPIPYELIKEFDSEMPIRAEQFKQFSFNNFELNTTKPINTCYKENRGVYLPPNSNAAVELDAGELTKGYFLINMNGGKDSKLNIRYAECYSIENEDGSHQKGVRDDFENYKLYGHEDVYYPSGGEDSFEPFLFRTFRFVRIEVKTGEYGITIYPPKYRQTGYPMEIKSWVTSSENWIKPLWDISIRTMKMCMQESYQDCPYYEQLQYTMDTGLQMLFTYSVSTDIRLAVKAIEDFHSSLLPEGILQCKFPSNQLQVIPVFSIYWIFMIEEFYWQTCDVHIVKRYRPTIDAILDWFDRRIGSLGMVEKLGYWEQADWVEEWQDIRGTPRAALIGPSTIHSLMYAAALKSAARLSRFTGRIETGVEYDQRANTIIRIVDRLCWCENEGLYREGPNFEEYSQHAQVWYVLCNGDDKVKAASILDKALNKKGILKCSYSMSFYLFRALESAGIYDRTEVLWEQWKGLLKINVTTWPETPYKPRSECHAWGSLPIYEFTRCLLGVKPLLPGWREILIEPQLLSIKSMEGKVVTPKGNVYLKWQNIDNKLTVSGEGPTGIPIELKLPSGKFMHFKNGGIFSVEVLL